MQHIVGMMFNKNEADILNCTISKAITKVDSLFIADDGSSDNSWQIIQDFKNRYPDKIEHIQQEPTRNDPGQRQSLLDKIRQAYLPDRAWVQVIESDIVILDTDVREAIRDFAVGDIGVTWQTLNACKLKGEWDTADEYPDWSDFITNIMPYWHWMEVMLYSYRPLPDLHYNPGVWRPWPSGFANYVKGPLKIDNKQPNSPLLLHLGFRGPTHFYEKYKYMGQFHKRYRNWNLTSVETIKKTVPFFSGVWNNAPRVASREGWIKWLTGK